MKIPVITTFANPWPIEGEYDKATTGRVSADMPLDVKHAVTSLRPQLGTPQIVINILWAKLLTALNEHSINNFTQQSEFCDFVANCRIVAGRSGSSPANDDGSSTAGAVPEATALDVSRGKASGAGTNPQPADKSCDASRTNGAGSGSTASGKAKGSKGQRPKGAQVDWT